MELEIKYSLMVAAYRYSNGKVVLFVCQVRMAGERPYIILLKNREKEDDEKPLHIGDAPQSSSNLSGEVQVPSNGFNFAKHLMSWGL